ncbi:ribonuclease H protein [Trifolium medium]|uniref:Ribonuclease H protein n=1 Tax=Trifolium medium TaxID=97028 RepID=A0A392QXW7_9FABA|nr:ribonuclease H protein [Trifolium medium]
MLITWLRWKESKDPPKKHEYRWIRPHQGYLSLNADGAVKNGSDQQAGCGDVIRDGNSSWVCGFAKALGPCSAFVAELWGIFEEILITKDRNKTRLEVQVDSKAVLQCLTSSKNGSI